MLELRDYQVDFVARLADAFRTHQSVVGVSPCGSGKTPTTVALAARSAKKGHSVIVTLPRKELMRQTAYTFDQFGVPYGYIAAGWPSNPFARIQLASMATLQNRYERFSPSFLVVDEGHFAMAKGQRTVIEHYKNQGCKVLLLTASPERLDGKGLGALCTELVEGPSVSWLMDRGHLSQYRAYAPSRPDLTGVHSRMGDYANGELEAAMDKPSITGLATDAWGKYARGMRTIGYCVSREHSRHTVDLFNAAGINAEHMDGETPDTERKAIIRRFASGQTLFLSNVEICTVGFDLSAQIGRDVPIEAVSLLRPTQSRALHIQMVGRAMRKKQNPAIILDHSNSLMTHGLPDQDIEWTLDGRGKSNTSSERSIATSCCGSCFAIFRPAYACPFCGEVREISAREVELKEGELAEIDVEKMILANIEAKRKAEFEAKERTRRTNAARTIPELVKVAKENGYRLPGFVAQKLKGRGVNVNGDVMRQIYQEMRS